MTDERNEIDPQVRELLRRTDPAPLGLTTRLEVKLERRTREAGRLTLTEGVCVAAVCGLAGAGGGAIATVLALLVGIAYARWTILVEA
jgi:hypothetical protein